MSLSRKTKKWLDKKCGISLKGKTVVVTGSNSGVGFKTAEVAVYLGADVILACRNAEKVAAARDGILKDHPGASVRVMRLDLASFDSIESFAAELKEKNIDVYAFVNNAGAFHRPGKKTEDGLDLVIGTNYIGTYYLSKLLIPYLSSLPHVVYYINTVSVIVKIAKPIDYADFYCEKKPRNLAVYARSKLCLEKYTYALSEKMKDKNVRVMMNHPGVSITPLGVNAYGKWVKRLSGLFKHLANSPEKSSLSLPFILSHGMPDGSLAGPHIIFDCFGYPKKNRLPNKAKTGAEELIRFTDNEIEKARSR